MQMQVCVLAHCSTPCSTLAERLCASSHLQVVSFGDGVFDLVRRGAAAADPAKLGVLRRPAAIQLP